MNTKRIAGLIENATEAFSLDLSGLCVYTEAATGNYACTAPIAAFAGAEEVIAVADDSTYGTAADAKAQTGELAEELNCRDLIRFVDKKREQDASQADVVTNTGFVRPIDSTFVSWMKPTAAVPLMFEPWEFRDADVDLTTCWRRGIPVLGTDERDDRIATQRYLGPLAAKLLFENDVEVLKSRLGVVGSGRMAVHAAEGLRALGAEVTHVAPKSNTPELDRSRKATRFGDAPRSLDEMDAIVVVEHYEEYEIFGDWSGVTAAGLADANPAIQIIHICGAIDSDGLSEASIPCTPVEPAPAGSMSFTTGYLGPRPVVDLHAAGLRIGELSSRRRLAGNSLRETISEVTDYSFASDFSRQFKRARDFDELVD